MLKEQIKKPFKKKISTAEVKYSIFGEFLKFLKLSFPFILKIFNKNASSKIKTREVFKNVAQRKDITRVSCGANSSC